ncbi:MAG: SDR family NAD(P)-dependent oxidoreductase [Planctomycetota bacterium]
MSDRTAAHGKEDDRSVVSRRNVLQYMAAVPLTYGVFASAAHAASQMSQPGSSRTPVALITGCSSGFGLVTARTLARNGFRVFASMRDVRTRNAQVADELRQLALAEKLRLDVVEIDIDSDASVDDGVASVLESADQIDVLFNNAGINVPGPIELSMDAARQSFETNVFGQLRMLRAVAPGMRANRHGLVIQMSSGLGRLVQPTSGLYSATKFAQEALFESAAYELHPFGVEVAIVQPSDYDTRIKANSRRYFRELLDGLDAADRRRAGDYASHIEITKATLEDAPAPPPQEVADIVLKLANTPAGQRPLRTVAMPPEIAEGLNQLNGTLEQVQAGLLQSSGMGDWLELTR